MRSLFLVRTQSEVETHKRILLSVWAYAYEIENKSIVSDHHFDQVAASVDLTVPTARPDLDQWFRNNFDPSTGMWIRNHPEIERIREIYHERHNA